MSVTLQCKSFIYGQALRELRDNIIPNLERGTASLDIETDKDQIHLRCQDEKKLQTAVMELTDVIDGLMDDHQAESLGQVAPELVPIMIGKEGFYIKEMRSQLIDELKDLDEEGIYRRSPIWIRLEKTGDYTLRMPYLIINSAERMIEHHKQRAEKFLQNKQRREHQRRTMTDKDVKILRRATNEKEAKRVEEAKAFQQDRIAHKALYAKRQAERDPQPEHQSITVSPVSPV